MKSGENSNETGKSGSFRIHHRQLNYLLVAVVLFEALMVTAGALYFLFRMFMESVENTAGAVVIFIITVLIASGLWAAGFATLKTQRWTRGAIITWQILQLAVATSFLQGLQEWQPVGWVLLVLSLLGIALVVVSGILSGKNDD